MRHRFFAGIFLGILVAVAPAAEAPRQVVVVVFDGMRPDFISAETSPNLWRLANEGVFFAHHHPVYLSATEVNGTAIATGAYPARSGMIANSDFRPAINAEKTIATENPAAVHKGDEVSDGHYLGASTVAEILHAHGIPTAIAGTKQVALLHDRAPRENSPTASPILYEGDVMPGAIKEALGAFPPIGAGDEKSARDAWTTRALLDTFWKERVPAFSLLWLAEPDYSQHATGPGSVQSLAGIKSSDNNLGLVLAALEKRGLRDTTDVLVVSDHGFSTITRRIDVAAELTKAGFAAKRSVPGGLQKGDVLAVSNTGSTLFFVGDHDAEVCRRLVTFLQKQDWTGVIFAHEPAEGTFPLAEARINSATAPDFVVSWRWTHGASATGAMGLLTADNTSSSRPGGHASLSRYDMHNTLVAAGPDFRRGVMDSLPSGNTDVAPTVLWVLGLREEAAKMDGRVLSEALTIEAPVLKSFELKRLNARRPSDEGVWEQYLQVSEVNGVRYLDEGNGELRQRTPPPP